MVDMVVDMVVYMVINGGRYGGEKLRIIGRTMEKMMFFDDSVMIVYV